MALLKGSSVLMICQKNNGKAYYFSISDRLVALSMGPIFMMRDQGTQCYSPRRTLEGSKDVRRKTFVSTGTPP